MLARLLLLVAALVFGATAEAQTGHPIKGSWSGNLTADGGAVTHMRLLMANTKTGDLTGSVNPGKNGVTMTKVDLAADTWTLIINAPLKEGALVLTGKVSNLGSWTNRKYTGTYTLGSQKGKFEFRIN
ncbi:MAG TPA: hypothetical protein VMH83_05575 [Candidatus Acidoferrum sp.]|nr:hypothetical protein [Candidatus Acidoferrum sp.]